jgi:hypothetical protein
MRKVYGRRWSGKKYLVGRGFSYLMNNPKNSPVWSDLQKVRHLYTSGRVMLLGDGKCINFWEDPWCGLVPLKERFGDLYEICVQHNKSVAEMASKRWNLNFRRWLDERAQNQLRQLRDMLTCCALSNEKIQLNGYGRNLEFFQSNLCILTCYVEIYTILTINSGNLRRL